MKVGTTIAEIKNCPSMTLNAFLWVCPTVRVNAEIKRQILSGEHRVFYGGSWERW